MTATPPPTARNWADETARLARDAVLAPFIERGHAFVIFDEGGVEALHANAAGHGILGQGFTPVSRNRLAALAQGLAPASGLRLERLQLGDPANPNTLTMICRRVRLSGETSALLIAALAPAPAPAAPPPTPAPADPAAGAAPPPSPAPPPRERVRLIWERTAAGDLRLISSDSAEAIGGDGVDAMDRHPLRSLIGPRIADPTGALAAALAQDRSWSGVETLWRIGDGAEGVRVVMSGLPAGPGGALRGFAVAHLTQRAPFPALLASSPEPSSAAKAGSAAPEPPHDEPRLPRATFLPPPPPDPSPAPPLNVVPLRADDPPPKPSLTTSERNAFREIAKALGARLEGDEPAAVEAAPESPVAQPGGREPAPAEPPALPAAAAPGRPEEPAEESVEALSADIIRLTPPQRPREDAYADLIDKLPIGVLVLRADRCVYANRTLLDLLDHEDVRALNEAGIARLFLEPPPSEGGGVLRLVRRDGGHEPVDARLSAISWHGEPATLMSFRRALDNVDAARLEAAKLDTERAATHAKELSAILDTATDGVITLDARGRILSLNRSAEALFGYDQREVTGENFTLLFAPESHITALDYLDGLKGGGVASLLNDGREVQGRVRQGGRIPLFMTMGRVNDGEETKYSAVLRDMTAWKRAEADLVEARRSAEKASEQKSDVLAKISHEIRTPLNAIIGFTEVMSEERFGPIGNERYKGYLQDIQQSGAYLLSLINDLLDLAKIEAGRMDLTFTGVNVTDLATGAVALLQPEANRQRVVLRTGLAPKLPSVVADERSLRQIIINVLSNAVKFTDPGGQVILSTAVGDRGEVILRVRDTGIGMDEKELKQALEPFRQVSATRRGQGTGLGLPITKALVEANKGALAISSAKNEGTLVEITFPPQRVLAS